MTFSTLSLYIAMHVEFRQTCTYKIAAELEVEVDQVVLLPPVIAWFFKYFDKSTAPRALESYVEIVRDNAGLIQAKPAYIPFYFHQILNRSITAAKSS